MLFRQCAIPHKYSAYPHCSLTLYHICRVLPCRLDHLLQYGGQYQNGNYTQYNHKQVYAYMDMIHILLQPYRHSVVRAGESDDGGNQDQRNVLPEKQGDNFTDSGSHHFPDSYFFLPLGDDGRGYRIDAE